MDNWFGCLSRRFAGPVVRQDRCLRQNVTAFPMTLHRTAALRSTSLPVARDGNIAWRPYCPAYSIAESPLPPPTLPSTHELPILPAGFHSTSGHHDSVREFLSLFQYPCCPRGLSFSAIPLFPRAASLSILIRGLSSTLQPCLSSPASCTQPLLTFNKSQSIGYVGFYPVYLPNLASVPNLHWIPSNLIRTNR